MKRVIDIVALVLVIVGALNWGLVGLFEFDLVAFLFGAGSILSRIVYVLVAVSGLWCTSLIYNRGKSLAEDTSMRSNQYS